GFLQKYFRTVDGNPGEAVSDPQLDRAGRGGGGARGARPKSESKRKKAGSNQTRHQNEYRMDESFDKPGLGKLPASVQLHDAEKSVGVEREIQVDDKAGRRRFDRIAQRRPGGLTEIAFEFQLVTSAGGGAPPKLELAAVEK